MKALLILILPLFILSCSPAPPPVSVSTRSVPLNERAKTTNKSNRPPRPVDQMVWLTADGTESSIAKLKGKVIILDLWATYCPPCRDEIPHLNELQTKHGADNLQVVGLNVGGDEDRPKIPAFAREYNIVYPIAFPEDDLAEAVSGGDDRIPQTAVYDRSGKLVKKIVGFDAAGKRDLDAAVEIALGSK